MNARWKRGRRRRLFAAGAAVLLTVGLAACSAEVGAIVPELPEQHDGPLPEAMTEQLDAALAQAIAWSASSGAIAGVWAPWGGEWTSAQGVSTVGGTTPLSTDMHFRSAAGDRPMVCTVMLELADAGTLSVSDPVAEYLPDQPGLEGITLGQLCQGTSGLADYRPQFQAQFVNNPTREWSGIELISGGLAATRTEPGTTWQDSATAIGVLGLALTAASGQSWAELYDEYIFTPLGLSETSVPSGDEFRIESPAPHGYAAAVNPDGSRDCAVVHDETKLSPSLSGVTGGVVSTLDDLKRWSQVLAEGSLLSNRSADAQLATISLGGDSPTWKGYGLGVQTLGPLVGHDGEIPGFLTAAYADPETGFTVVVMLNNSTAGKGFAQQLAMHLASIASKAPAAGSTSAPTIELPWSAEQATAALQAAAVCQPAPAG